jgi:hypothetical protein
MLGSFFSKTDTERRTTSSGVIAPKTDTDPGMTRKPPPQDPSETPVIQPSKGAGGEPDAGAS